MNPPYALTRAPQGAAPADRQSRTRGTRLILSGVCLAVHAAAFADAATDRAERARIDRERAVVEQRFKAKDAECRQRFVVTSCVDAAQRERQEALKPLRMQQQLLDEAARRERAAQRLDSIRQKEEGADAKQREAMAREQQRRMRDAASAASSAGGAGSRSPSTKLPREHGPAIPRTSAASAAARAGDYADRQREVEEHREEVARRNAERDAKGKKAIPLPIPAAIPPAASAPR